MHSFLKFKTISNFDEMKEMYLWFLLAMAAYLEIFVVQEGIIMEL